MAFTRRIFAKRAAQWGAVGAAAAGGLFACGAGYRPTATPVPPAAFENDKFPSKNDPEIAWMKEHFANCVIANGDIVFDGQGGYAVDKPKGYRATTIQYPYEAFSPERSFTFAGEKMSVSLIFKNYDTLSFDQHARISSYLERYFEHMGVNGVMSQQIVEKTDQEFTKTNAFTFVIPTAQYSIVHRACSKLIDQIVSGVGKQNDFPLQALQQRESQPQAATGARPFF